MWIIPNTSFTLKYLNESLQNQWASVENKFSTWLLSVCQELNNDKMQNNEQSTKNM